MDKVIEEIKKVGALNWANANPNKLKLIKRKMKKYATNYYEGKALITDADFECLVDVLKILNASDEYLQTPGWGYKIKKGINHIYGKIDTLKYFYNYNDVFEILKNETNLIIMPKYDGINFVAYFKNGKFEKCATRGNGYLGKDITKKFIKNQLLNNILNKDFAINGEVIFDNKLQENKFEFRDIVANYCNKKTFVNKYKNNIKFVPFGILNSELIEYKKQINLLNNIYFEELNFYEFEKLPNKKYLEELYLKIRKEYAIDGLVITTKNKEIQIAYKFYEE